MSVLAGSRGKLQEARFFLELLKRIENGQPATTESCDNEATYFTSALLNACYSVLAHLSRQGKQALRVPQTRPSKELVSCAWIRRLTLSGTETACCTTSRSAARN